MDMHWDILHVYGLNDDFHLASVGEPAVDQKWPLGVGREHARLDQDFAGSVVVRTRGLSGSSSVHNWDVRLLVRTSFLFGEGVVASVLASHEEGLARAPVNSEV